MVNVEVRVGDIEGRSSPQVRRGLALVVFAYTRETLDAIAFNGEVP